MLSKGSGVWFMVLSVVLYTTANLCVKALSDLPTEQLVLIRSAISLIMCIVFLKIKGLPILGNNRKWLLIRGVFGMIALTAFFHTIRFIPLASATVIQYLSPVFTVVLALVFMGERVVKSQWLLLGAAFVGIAFVKGFDARISWLYFSLGLLSAVFASVAYLATMKCRGTDHPVGVVIWFHLIAVPVMGSFSIFSWQPMTTTDWILGAAVGVLSLIAQVAMTYALHREDAGVVMPFKYIGAILALVLGYIIFDESLSLMSILGILIVIISVSLNTWLKKRGSSTT